MEKNGLIIGYDLCKDFCRISCFRDGEAEPEDFAFSDNENPYILHNSICKKKGADQWFVGAQAYEAALMGSGAVVDKLLKIVEMNGFSTLEGKRYSAEDLLYYFIRESLSGLLKSRGTNEIASIVFTLQEPEPRVIDALNASTKRLGLPEGTVHVISHTESFLYFAISQKRELWTNLSVLYDLSANGLHYYEMETLRGMTPNVARAKCSFLEDGFSPAILSSSSGQRLADNIMTSCIDRMLSKKVVSSVYLSGNGMEKCQEWGPSFIKLLCQRRRVFYIENLFAKGAAYAAADRLNPVSAYPFRFMCKGHIDVDICLSVMRGSNRQNLCVAAGGENWFDVHTEIDFIVDEEDAVRFTVRRLNDKTDGEIIVPLDEFKKLGRRENRYHLSAKFISGEIFSVTVTDKGFGDFYPASDVVVNRSFRIGKEE